MVLRTSPHSLNMLIDCPTKPLKRHTHSLLKQIKGALSSNNFKKPTFRNTQKHYIIMVMNGKLQ